MFKEVNVKTQENTYDTPPGDQAKGKVVDQPSTSTPPYSTPLHIGKPISNVIFLPPKIIIQKETFNPNSYTFQN
jgi:hypothetical protein